MFHRTGSRIKQFISPKKNKKVEEKEKWPHSYARQRWRLSPNSWICQNRKSMDEAFVRQTNNNGLVLASSPPLPSPLSTQYSLISFCKCGCNSPIRSPPHSLSKFDASSGSPKDLCLEQDESQQLILVNQSNSAVTSLLSNVSTDDLDETASTLQIDLFEALALEPVKRSHRASLTMSNSNSDGPLTDAQQLTRETYHAFKESGATATSQNYDSSALAMRKISPRVETRGQHQRQDLPKVILTKPESAIHQERKEHHIRRLKFSHKSSTTSDSLPTLAELRKNSTVVSSHDRFKQTNMNRIAESDGTDYLCVESPVEKNLRPSSETSRSTGSGSTGSTLLEPFHLEDLPLRIKLAEDLLTEGHSMRRIDICRSAASTLTLLNSVPARSFGPSRSNVKVRDARYTSVSKHEVVLKSTNFSLTSLGYKHGNIRIERRSRPVSKSGINSSARLTRAIPQTASSQADRSASRVRDEDEAVEEESDLPLFQMAPSGTTDHHWMSECENCFNSGSHPQLEELEVKVDELVKWCSDLGLDTDPLVQSEFIAEKGLRDAKWSRRSRSRKPVDSMATAENPSTMVGLSETGQHLRIDAEGHGENDFNPLPLETTRMEVEASLESGGDEKRKDSHDGEESLPPSPMQSIDPSALVGSKSFVTMGFNVNHDLRDYLRWKSECVESTADVSV